MRLWIAAFLLLIFAFQALPVAALGKLCSKAQSASSADNGGDDDSADDDDGKGRKGNSFSEDAYLHVPGFELTGSHTQAVRAFLLHCAEQLPLFHPGDVTTPPPDFC